MSNNKLHVWILYNLKFTSLFSCSSRICVNSFSGLMDLRFSIHKFFFSRMIGMSLLRCDLSSSGFVSLIHMIMLITCLRNPKCCWILKSEFKFEVPSQQIFRINWNRFRPHSQKIKVFLIAYSTSVQICKKSWAREVFVSKVQTKLHEPISDGRFFLSA
jgi:hypothetical protein